MGVEGAALLPLGGPGKGVVGTLLLLRHRGIGLPLLHPPPRPPPAFPTLGLLLPPLIPAFTPIIHCCFARHVPHVAERRCGAVRCFPAGQDGCVGGVAAGVPSSPPRSHARLIHPNHTRTTASSSLVTRRWCGVVFAGGRFRPAKIPAQLPLWQGRPRLAGKSRPRPRQKNPGPTPLVARPAPCGKSGPAPPPPPLEAGLLPLPAPPPPSSACIKY